MQTRADSTPSHAFHCGRLLAILDSIHRNAGDHDWSPLAERLFVAASTTPAGTLAPLLAPSWDHLCRIRLGPHGVVHEEDLSARLESVLVALGRSLPAELPADERSHFALGFYQERSRERQAGRLGSARSGQELDEVLSEETIDPADLFPDDL